MASRSNWIEHALRNSQWQPQRQVVALATLGFFIALILGALYLTQVASEATTNRRLEELLDQRDDLERINELIRVEIAQQTGLGNLQRRAEEMGFQLADDEQIIYLVVEGYQPQQPDTVAPVEPLTDGDDAGSAYNETFTGWLERQWDSFMGSIGG